MVTKSRLQLALAAERGVDFKKLKEKKTLKENIKRKRGEAQAATQPEIEDAELDNDEEPSEDGEGEEEAGGQLISLVAVDESDTSDSSVGFEDKFAPSRSKAKSNSTNSRTRTDKPQVNGEEEEEEEEEEDEEDIPVSDLEDLDEEDKEDLIPHTRLTINNTTALLAALKRISIPTDNAAPFSSHQSIVSTTDTSASIPDVSDDLQRELAFYSQSLDAVRLGRAKLRAEGVPFSRPKDYFAEMVKEDAHMEKVKAKLVEEAASKKAAVEARKQRDLKKFGKQVQVAKLQERHKEKRETLDKIKTLKRKRQETGGSGETKEADLFDVGINTELAKKGPPRTGTGRGQAGTGRSPAGPDKPNFKRSQKNEKYGFGGKKRHIKSGDAQSSGDLSSFNAKKMKAKAPRPGKSKRQNMASR